MKDEKISMCIYFFLLDCFINVTEFTLGVCFANLTEQQICVYGVIKARIQNMIWLG